MDRREALRILGLDESATPEDIKIAYKEVAQILHPDRFASSKKLQDRATEQFKNLQEAYEFLDSHKNSSGKNSRATSATYSSPAGEYEARLAGIAAARTQLVAQSDLVYDERRNGILVAAVSAVATFLFRRFPPVIALGTAGIVWGIVRLITMQSTLNNLNNHIKQLNKEEKKIIQELEDIE